jgi:hypothetical protein
MTKKVFTFKEGDRVGEFTSQYQDNDYDDSHTGPLRYDEDNDPEYGQVTDVLSSGKVLVSWDNDYRKQYPRYTGPQDPAGLAPEEVVKAQYSKLEVEFKEVEKEIKAKLKEASTSIREANKLAKKVGRPLAQMYNMFYGTLYKAMDDAGWRTSSFGC